MEKEKEEKNEPQTFLAPKYSVLRPGRNALVEWQKYSESAQGVNPPPHPHPQERNICLKGGAGGGGEGEAKEEVSERRASLKHMKEEAEGKKRWRCWWMWEEIITSIL